jgi:hypothetical protein
LTGLSRKAMARRVERGSVRSVLRSGRRLIPRSELVRVGLLPSAGESGVGLLADLGVAPHIAVSQRADEGQSLTTALVRELVDVLQRQAAELAQYRALTVEAESLRLEREVADLRVRLSVLEGGEVRALERSAEQPTPPHWRGQPGEPLGGTTPSDERLWLPSSAVPAQTGSTHGTIATGWTTQAMNATQRSPRTRLVSLALEILFIGLVAFFAWLADLGPALGAAAVGVAWLVAATFELVRWLST